MDREWHQLRTFSISGGAFLAFAASLVIHCFFVMILWHLGNNLQPKPSVKRVQLNLKNVFFRSAESVRSDSISPPPVSHDIDRKSARSLDLSRAAANLNHKNDQPEPVRLEEQIKKTPTLVRPAPEIIAQQVQVRKQVNHRKVDPSVIKIVEPIPPIKTAKGSLDSKTSDRSNQTHAEVKKPSAIYNQVVPDPALQLSQPEAIKGKPRKSPAAANDSAERKYPLQNSVGDVAPVLEAPLAESYINVNYGPIRDKVRGNLRYPAIARRQGWSGRVEIEFTISLAGSLESMRIVSSSGYPMLDRQALRALEVSAPFPQPEIVATMVLPITFTLE